MNSFLGYITVQCSCFWTISFTLVKDPCSFHLEAPFSVGPQNLLHLEGGWRKRMEYQTWEAFMSQA